MLFIKNAYNESGLKWHDFTGIRFLALIELENPVFKVLTIDRKPAGAQS